MHENLQAVGISNQNKISVDQIERLQRDAFEVILLRWFETRKDNRRR